MGFLDALLGKVYDDATSSRKAKRREREQVREILLVAVRDYADKMEILRVTLLTARDRIQDLQPGDAQPTRLAVEGHVVPALDATNLESIDSALAIVPDSLDDLRSPSLSPEAIQLLWSRPRDRHGTGPSNDLGSLVRAASYDFDAAWPALRTALDESLEADIVEYLRELRHELRARIAKARHAAEEFTATPTREAKGELLDCLEEILVLIDRWKLHVGTAARQP